MPESSLDIYLIAIGGTGMAPLACLLKEKGHRVRGSDKPLYPPMSTLLAEAGIKPLVDYKDEHLENEPRPDLVIVGNAVPRHNPEIEVLERLGLDKLSMPEALARFFLAERQPLVISGTHGKSTTTTLASWVYRRCGQDPGFLIGGMPRNFEQSFQVGTGPRFILEGDEYNAAYFDRGPKFLHYQPQTLILTSVEYDHADLYPDPAVLLEAYTKLVRLLPEDGLLIAHGDSPEVRDVAAEAASPALFYGLEPINDVYPVEPVEWTSTGCRVAIADPDGTHPIELEVPGEHNLLNALAVWTAARRDGLAGDQVAAALRDFRGVKRRLEEIGVARGVTVIDDFAHHPTAVAKSLGGLRNRFPRQRLAALFEPRSLTAGRAMFFEPYREAFRQADGVFFAPVFYGDRLDEEECLDLSALCQALAGEGVEGVECGSIDEVLARSLAWARPGDVLVTMSSGSFDHLPQRLLAALRESEADLS